MIEWKEQGGAAVVGQVVFKDGTGGSVVLVAPRDNAKGATIVRPGSPGEKPEMLAFMLGIDGLRPGDVVQILAMQERLFGTSGLQRPEGFTVGSGEGTAG